MTAPLSSPPSVWVILPFGLLLLMIATGPLLYHRLWERHYPKISIGLASVVAGYYLLAMDHGFMALEHALEEYLSFIALISSLFIVSGGILIKIRRRGNPFTNSLLLLVGAVLANLVGTTGASMLLIRPYMRMNEGRMKAFHIVFFIMIVSNIGGVLTPIGDPPLFLGFLKGVPFFWGLPRVWLMWIIALALLLIIFAILDALNGDDEPPPVQPQKAGIISMIGTRNLLFLLLIVAAVFLDPAVIDGFPSLQKMLHVPFGIREVIMAIVAIAAYRMADKEALKGNEFNFEPIREVAFLFIGIFITMIPALELIGDYARTNAEGFTVTSFFWMTGGLSGVLDNAPTYLNLLSAALGKYGLSILSRSDVAQFANGIVLPGAGSSELYLVAISVASVFFGALTYMGNAPNFMVKNIAAQAEVDVPDFLEYIYKYSIPVLLPVFALFWFLFFQA